MANPKLTVEIDADVSKMEKELSKANKLLAQHERNYAGVQKAISSNTQTARNLERQISSLSNEFKSGTISEKQYARETDRLSNELREVNSSTSNYQRELRRLENEMQRAKNATDNYARSTSQTQTATRNTQQAIGGMAKTTRVNAVPAMTSFSQVVQDAPYGIQGVANNIQQLTMQMGYLSTSAGGTGKAMKALVASLAGPAGILLAVSAVTTGIQALSQSGVRMSDVLGFITGRTTKLAMENRKLAESYRESQSEVQGEVEVLQSLLAIARDENKSRADRQRAIDAVNDKFPELHENLRLETVGSQKATDAVNTLTEALLRQAKIEGVRGAISDLYADMAEMAEKSAVDSANLFDWLTALANPAGNLSQVITSGLENQGEEQEKLNSKLERYRTILQDLIGEDIELKGVFTEVESAAKSAKGQEPIRVPIQPVLDTGALGATNDLQLAKDIMSQIKALEQLQKTLPETSKEYEFLGNQIQFLQDRLSGFNTTLTESANKSLEEFGRMASGIASINEEQQSRLEEQAKQHAQQQQMIAGIVSSSFAAMGGELIDAASKGEVAFKDLTSIILKSVGKMLTALLSQAIGNAVLAGTQSSLAAGPGAAFAMPGLIGLTTGAVQSSFPAFQDGGIMGGSSMFGDKIFARINSKEAVFNQDQQKAIWGQMNTPPMVGMGEPIEIVGETVIDGDSLRVIYQRNERNRSRQT